MSVSHVVSVLAPVPGSVAPVVPGEVPGLLQVLALLVDPRDRRGVRHRLVTVLALAVIAVLGGATSYREIGDLVADLPRDLLALVGTRRDATSRQLHAASGASIRRVLISLDADRFDQVTGACPRRPASPRRR